VTRLKSLKNDLVREAAGLEPLTWVRKNRLGQWYGIIGALFRYSRCGEVPWKRVLIALSSFTGFRPLQPTVDHVLKFRNSVENGIDHCSPVVLKGVIKSAKTFVGRLDLNESTPLIFYEGSPRKNAPTLGSSVRQDSSLALDLEWFKVKGSFSFASVYYNCYGPVLEGLVQSVQLVNCSHMVGKTGYHQVNEYDFHPSKSTPPFVGNVVPLTKDGGWKVRWIANPLRIHQLALRPLGLSLFDALRRLPWDCTFDQARPLVAIQRHLAQGKMAYAVDLTAATDQFPLSLQIGLLEAVYPIKEHVLLFRDLSRGWWRTPYGPTRWVKGQPMGLYPSFPSFAFAHGMLLAYLNGNCHKDKFFILGDDVVILDEKLYRKYMVAIAEMGCPVDENKSICSSKLTEFAGKIIFPDKIYPKFKIGLPESHEDSFMDLMRTYGQGFENFLPARLARIYKIIGPLDLPFGANQSVGHTLSLVRMTYLTEIFKSLLPDDKGGKLHVSFLKYLADRLKPEEPDSLWSRLGGRIFSLLDTFERRYTDASKSIMVPLIHEDLTDVFELTGVNPGLPSVGSDSWMNRRTLYQTLSNVVRRYKQLVSQLP
jgi:hypothetical protein